MPLHVPGLPDVPLILRRSARARRFSLRVSRLDGRVTLSVPARAKVAEALAFAGRHADWLRGVMDDLPAGQPVTWGTALPVEGRARIVTSATGRVRVEGDALCVPGPAPGPRVQGWLRGLARDRLATACDRHAATIGLRYTRLTLRDTRSRWGSCTADGALMFSWRLILAPPEVLDYVAAHEVAHLDQMNHSPAFWAVVARLCPDYAPRRAWLRGPGGEGLHAWRFA
ncbi:M48 family metallopeptidase [Falsirhodobacter halotolerans]|uniref:M48 family metallopeptidase n=1 Tax=Falsirhodobacter halotolerans TaxID=1146892 RepID=UPI001FD155A6|nr:SprT family zinc-dependent metalloprotease [Falsirhodobacter halotolerans]MCJ8138821.1 M48 family metallopeptidase [Falsirhodobacter halotolerans]